MSTSLKTFCVIFVFTVFFFSNTTASPLDIHDQCDYVIFDDMRPCLDYLGTGLYERRIDHPSSSCCSVVRDLWYVYPKCVEVNNLGEFMFSHYFGYDTDITRVAQVTLACGIGDESRKPSARPPVAASPLEAGSPVAAVPSHARPLFAASPLEARAASPLSLA